MSEATSRLLSARKPGKPRARIMPVLFLAGLFALFLIFDIALSMLRPAETLDLFVKNDFEKTVASHPEIAWHNVIYGNSAVISAYKEHPGGYINLGLDYGTIVDLREMLDRGIARVDGNIVLGLNYFNFLDTMETNPTYPWHRSPLEPYIYFQRSRFKPLITNTWQSLISGGGINPQRHTNLEKTVYHGKLPDQEMADKIEVHKSQYWTLEIGSFARNLDALRDLAKYCADSHIRLRALWVPWNPDVPMPEISKRVMREADAIFEEYQIEVRDMTGALSADCFHDIGHLTWEYGAEIFTEEMDKWLDQ